MKILKIYTDGSYRKATNRGAASFLVLKDNLILTESCKLYEDEEENNNNRMELMAVVNALNWVRSSGYSPKLYRIYIYTDSQYVQLGMSNLIHTWESNDWKSLKGRKIQDIDLWKYLHNIMQTEFNSLFTQWVEGHSKDTYNTQVDKLCKIMLNSSNVNIKIQGS